MVKPETPDHQRHIPGYRLARERWDRDLALLMGREENTRNAPTCAPIAFDREACLPRET
jgi:hypothetical protein